MISENHDVGHVACVDNFDIVLAVQRSASAIAIICAELTRWRPQPIGHRD